MTKQAFFFLINKDNRFDSVPEELFLLSKFCMVDSVVAFLSEMKFLLISSERVLRNLVSWIITILCQSPANVSKMDEDDAGFLSIRPMAAFFHLFFVRLKQILKKK